MNTRPSTRIVRPTHERLRVLVGRWRREADRRRSVAQPNAATIYTQCANDLDLALRDDDTLQPRRRP